MVLMLKFTNLRKNYERRQISFISFKRQKMIAEKETYHFLHLSFMVHKFYLWAKKNLQEMEFDLNSIAKTYGFNAPKEYALSLSEQDLQQPIIVVDLGQAGSIMIDGTHRSYNLWKKGEKSIKGFHIKDEKAIIAFSNINKKMYAHLIGNKE